VDNDNLPDPRSKGQDPVQSTDRTGQTVYLLHFDRPYQAKTGKQKKTAGHYIGYTNDLRARMAEHASGGGARLMEIIALDGIGFTVARTWTGDRKTERHLKNRHNHRALCPCCCPERAARNAAQVGKEARP